MRYYFSPARMLSIKRQEITSVVEDVEKRAPLSTVGGNAMWGCHYGKQNMVVLQNIKNTNTHMTRQFHVWVFTQRK